MFEILSRTVRVWQRLMSIAKVKSRSLSLARSAVRSQESGGSFRELKHLITVVTSFRASTLERLEILDVVVSYVGRCLHGSGLIWDVTDASPDSTSARARETFSSIETGPSGLRVRYTRAALPLSVAYRDALHRCQTPYVYLQFDDQLTGELDPELLRDSCTLLDRFDGLLDVVSVLWPRELRFVEGTQSIEVVAHVKRGARRGRDTYAFGGTGFIKPRVLARVGTHLFGIFENFTYGFYFNHLVTKTSDYASRLEWYMDNVSHDAHEIELAADGRTLGPFWTHIAVCLDPVCLVDLDFQHTDASVRPEGTDNQRTFEKLQESWTLTVIEKTM